MYAYLYVRITIHGLIKGAAATPLATPPVPGAHSSAVAPSLPALAMMLAQLRWELGLGGDASLEQVESAAATAFGCAPNPSLTVRERTVALWREIVQQAEGNST